jgi:hypothetical protein
MSNDSEVDTPPPQGPPDPAFIKWLQENGVPIIGVLCILLGVSVVFRYSSTSVGIKDAAETFNNFIQAFALISGGLWAIFTFTKGRQFKESLVPTVSGKVVTVNGQTFIAVNTAIRNIGRSKIRFLTGACTLEVFEYIKTSVTDVITMPDKMIRRFDPLHAEDQYIEPNEIIYGARLIAIPVPPDLGFRLEFKIISAKHEYTWRTSCIVEKAS